MFKWIGAALAIVVLSAAASLVLGLFAEPRRAPHDPVAAESARQIALTYPSVSLVALLAAPERYDGKKVFVQGFLSLEYEGTGLHLDKAAYEAGLRSNALWLDRPGWLDPHEVPRIDRKYMQVAATFDASRRGAYGAYSGALTDVKSIGPTYTASHYQQDRLNQRTEVLLTHLRSLWFLSVVGWTGLIIFALLRKSSR